MVNYLTFLGFILLFLFPIFCNIFFFVLGILVVYFGLYKQLQPKKILLLVTGFFLSFPFYYIISLFFHRKIVINSSFFLKILISYFLFCLGNYFIYLVFKNTQDDLRKIAAKSLFGGALSTIFLVGSMVSWIGILILGISFLKNEKGE